MNATPANSSRESWRSVAGGGRMAGSRVRASTKAKWPMAPTAYADVADPVIAMRNPATAGPEMAATSYDDDSQAFALASWSAPTSCGRMVPPAGAEKARATPTKNRQA